MRIDETVIYTEVKKKKKNRFFLIINDLIYADNFGLPVLLCCSVKIFVMGQIAAPEETKPFSRCSI